MVAALYLPEQPPYSCISCDHMKTQAVAWNCFHSPCSHKFWRLKGVKRQFHLKLNCYQQSTNARIFFFSLQIFNTSQARSTQHSQYLLKVTKMQCDCDCALACFCSPSQRVLAQKRGLGFHRAGSRRQDDGSAQWPPGTESPSPARSELASNSLSL